MITFEQACVTVGYDRNAPAPKAQFKYLAYKKGEIREFKDMNSALDFSRFAEKVIINEGDVNGFREKQRELADRAMQYWKNELREEYRGLTDKQFDMLYERAYDNDSHCDSIVEEMERLYSFVSNFNSAA